MLTEIALDLLGVDVGLAHEDGVAAAASRVARRLFSHALPSLGGDPARALLLDQERDGVDAEAVGAPSVSQKPIVRAMYSRTSGRAMSTSGWNGWNVCR